MKTPARLVLLLLAGCSLAGCTSMKTATLPPPAKVALSEQTLSPRDYFLLRELELRAESILASGGR